jgi:hypothetical protein
MIDRFVPPVGLAILLFALFMPLAAAEDATKPATEALLKPAVPRGLGVNIHFTDPRPGEMKMLAEAGFTWVRMDFSWDGTERVKGEYDFSAYDRLLAALEEHKIRALLILDYHSRFYDEGLSPHSDEGRKAMARWAAAAAKRFQGRGILWEMYNEPNISFWKPKPNVGDYAMLALDVGKALREAAPGEMYIGPATSRIDTPFLEACFKAGLLDYWCAVSVHPYRQTPPETAADEYTRLRALVDQYAPKGKHVPILSGEWGYSAAWRDYDEVKQGKYLPRQWLVNLANDVPLSIWYDWHDDGSDPKEPEHHFGVVKHDYFADREGVYDPKPAYLAAKTLTTQLAGSRFERRLAVGGPEDYVLAFAKDNELRLAAWTTADAPRAVTIPGSPGKYRVTGHTGEPLPAAAADAQGLRLTLSDAPQYVVPQNDPKAKRILFLGNSITLHGPAPQIGWDGNWGMAASTREKDYVHVLADSLAKLWGTAPVLRIDNLADFERHYDTYDLNAGLDKYLDFKPDVVVVAIGENVATLGSDDAKARYKASFTRLLQALADNGRPKIFVRSCFWPEEVRDDIMRESCKRVGGVFVDIGALGKVESNYARSERSIAHAGVAGHPGDKGMKAIADALLGAMTAADKQTP